MSKFREVRSGNDRRRTRTRILKNFTRSFASEEEQEQGFLKKLLEALRPVLKEEQLF